MDRSLIAGLTACIPAGKLATNAEKWYRKRMETPEPVDLNFLARQLQRLATDVASLRDDMQVLTSIVLRQDGTLTALLQETRATHSQIQRMNDRVRALETS
jgi:hypothetical protein